MMRIEKLKRRDLRKLLPIESLVFPEPWSPEVFNSELALRKGRLYRAAWDGEEMAGYIGFLIVDEEAHMTTIATAPAYQRSGVAITMIVDAHADAAGRAASSTSRSRWPPTTSRRSRSTGVSASPRSACARTITR